MLDGDAPDGATVEQTADVFLSMLSEPENRKEGETPPTQESPESEQPVEVEASSEQAETEGESPEPEQTEETPAETSESNAVDPSTKLKTKIDGEEIEVTLEEALKGYSRTQDYTRKTQALAEARKAFETSEVPAVREERAQLAASLQQLEQIIDEVTPKEPDWDALRQANPTEFAAQWAQWDQHKKERAALREKREEAERAVAADRSEAYKNHLEAERVKLNDAIPEWKNVETAKAEKAELQKYALGLGFDEAALAQVTDHRVMVMLRKSMMFDKQQAKKPSIQERIERVKTATPGSAGVSRPPVSDQTRALQRLAKTGKQDDAAAAFLTMLG